MQSRWKSRTAWIATFCLITFVSKQYFGIELQEADKLLELILAVCAGFGIFNNPTNSEGY